MSCDADKDFCRIDKHGDLTVLTVTPEVETIPWEIIEQASKMILEPLRRDDCPQLIVDLTGVEYFGSVFLSLLLRCWKHVSVVGGTMVLCGATTRAQELLRVTALDHLWAIYDTKEEAIAALQAD